ADVGAGANIGCGTITANYDGVSKHRTRVGPRARTGSGTVLVAPVSVGEGAVTGANAVVLAGHDVPAGATAVGAPARGLAKASRERQPDGAPDPDRRRAARVGGADHGGDPVLRLREEGPEGRGPRADHREARGEPPRDGRRQPRDHGRPARGADPGLLRHTGGP